MNPEIGASLTDHLPLNVLVIGLNYAPELTGVAPYTSGLARGLAQRGHAVRALTTRPHYPEWKVHPGYDRRNGREIVDGADVTRLRHYVPEKPEGMRRLLSEVTFGLQVFFARWGKPDVVVLVSPALFSSAIAMVRARIGRQRPAVTIWIQDIYSLGITETGSGGRATARIVAWIERSTLKAASGVVVIHSRFRDYLSENLGVDPKRIEIVRNWTHLEEIPPIDTRLVRAAHGWFPEETVVLHAGNMGVKQALGNVIAAARIADEQEPPAQICLAGQWKSAREQFQGRGLWH
ncbi:glycosyltransferase [Cryobacterium breve]|uniref:glycosyltransferase n=1 Tax=Cryobacterium breve TaxID=1259258 RepID=UPI00248ABF5B|nr:glycosyltransferase [Cryobacterium breve]